MELLLLKVVAFIRPILLIDVGLENFFDIAAMLTFGLLAFTFITKVATQNPINFNAIDTFVLVFAIWAVCIYLVYFEVSSARSLAKLIIPFFTYTIARNMLQTKEQYRTVVLLIIIGFVPPVLLSVGLIATGHGMEEFGKNYWTGIPRWEGAFSGSHDMGHNSVLLLMAMAIFWTMSRDQSGKTHWSMSSKVGLAMLAAAALYCLWLSQVRTALFGLVLFVLVVLFFTNRKLLIVSVAAGGVLIALLIPILYPYLFPDLVMIEKGAANESYIASGRPVLWQNNLQRFLDMPIDRQIAGVGIGNKEGDPVYSGEGFTDSHNDFLAVLIHTGVVGFALFLAMQFFIFRRIWRIDDSSKFVFLAMFIAVTAMNFASNSYVSRFGLAQLYYILLAYVGMRANAVGAKRALAAMEKPVRAYRASVRGV